MVFALEDFTLMDQVKPMFKLTNELSHEPSPRPAVPFPDL